MGEKEGGESVRKVVRYGGEQGGRSVFGRAGEIGERGRKRQREGYTLVRSSVHWPLFAVFLCKLFSILQEFFTVL